MTSAMRVCLILLPLLVLCGCSENSTGPAEVKWDRDTCDRCGMVLSDHFHAAQVRGGPAGGKTRVYKFDDVGGAVAWLSEQEWNEAAGTELWVTDHRDGHWIDGFTATYLHGQMTPMDFGFGAQTEAAEGGMNFEAMRSMVLENEAKRRTLIPRS